MANAQPFAGGGCGLTVSHETEASRTSIPASFCQRQPPSLPVSTPYFEGCDPRYCGLMGSRKTAFQARVDARATRVASATRRSGATPGGGPIIAPAIFVLRWLRPENDFRVCSAEVPAAVRLRKLPLSARNRNDF